MKLKASIGHTALNAIPAQRICLCDLSRSFYMKEIKLTQGKVALVDDEDFEYLNQFKWCVNKSRNTYYAQRLSRRYIRNEKIKRDNISMHRFIMKPPRNMQIDHINRDGLDNRKENLRIVTNRENCQNKINSAEFVGVYKFKKKLRKPFAVRIYINGKSKTLGYFETANEASIAYKNESDKYIKY
jgi:hypothetical protein